MDALTSRKLETQWGESNYEGIVEQPDGTSYKYDMIAWVERRPKERYGRPLRRVRWDMRHTEDWSPLGPAHAMNGFCRPPTQQASAARGSADADDDALSDDEEVWWQFRGGNEGNGKWRWSKDSEWIEAAYQNRRQVPVATKKYDRQTYEYDFTAMVQRNLTSKSAPVRDIRRWTASLDLPSD